MNTPTNLKYTASHEWVRLDEDGSVAVGITDHAQEALGDIVFLELPTAGRAVAAEESIAVVESVKAASEIYAPIAGTIIAANQDAADAPDSVNSDAYGVWLFKIQPTNVADLDGLLDAAGYTAAADKA